MCHRHRQGLKSRKTRHGLSVDEDINRRTLHSPGKRECSCCAVYERAAETLQTGRLRLGKAAFHNRTVERSEDALLSLRPTSARQVGAPVRLRSR